ncbi:PQQ-binding-like beta-propeller repeat protein [Actinomadura sp. 9N407]|uniref:outer membrane protein assembly factor BamB family protein n=1 Tax=Actinomadura sp. 9N407 TaxID=3375154 RepID=UPI0037AC5D7E
MDVPPHTGDLDLSAVTDADRLHALLRTLQARAGLSYREVESRTRKAGHHVSKSNVAEILKGNRYPRRESLVAIVEACGVPPGELTDWVRAWERVAAASHTGPEPDELVKSSRQEAERIVAEARLEAGAILEAAWRRAEPPGERTAMFRGGPSRSGTYAPGIKPPSWRPWSFNAIGAASSSPVVEGRTVFLGGGGYLHAVDAFTGEENWRYQAGTVDSSAAVVDTSVYVGSGDGFIFGAWYVHSIDRHTGKSRWRFATDGPVLSSPAVAGGAVHVGCEDGRLWTLDAATGDPRWCYQSDGPVTSSPAVVHGVVYMGSQAGHLTALDARNGNVCWTVPMDGPVAASAAVVQGTVYVSTYSGRTYAMDALTGLLHWSFAPDEPINSSPAVDGTSVYVTTCEGNLWCLDAPTGRPYWKHEVGARLDSSPVLAGGIVYVGSADGCVYAIDTETRRRRWRMQTGGAVRSTPSAAHGIVYLRSDDGRLYAIDAETGASAL